MKGNNIVTINLEKSAHACSFGEGDLVHQIEFNRVEGWINERLEQVAQLPENIGSPFVRWNEAISIMGSRGSGKTSFLLSLLETYRNRNRVHVLDIIDPTLIEEKGHIFLTIISLIKECVEDKLKGCGCHPESNDYNKRQNWNAKLHSLSHGLPSIDGVGKNNEESWQDPEYIMNKGLRAVQSAKELEKNFHAYVKMSLDILEKDVFILSLDDIDVDFKKGWPVLETIRKYLTTPYIVTLISGDIDLFSKAIRKQHWRNFHKELLINEAQHLNKIGEYNELVTEMEGQYLQKVLRPDRRVHLNTLLEKIESYGMEIKIIEKTGASWDSIVKMYEELLSEFGIKNPSQSKSFYTYLLSLPLRTQTQFISLRWNTSIFDRAQITDSFLSDLYEKQVDVDLAKNNPNMFNVVVLRLLMREKVLTESYQLQPITTDKSLNSSLLALSLLFAQKVKNNPFLIFDYFIRIGYIRNLHDSLDYQENTLNPAATEYSPSIEGLCKQAGLFQDRVLRDAAGTIVAYIRGFLNYKNEAENLTAWAGTIPLKGLYSFAKKEPEGRIDAVFGYRLSPVTCLAYMPLSLSEYSMRNATIVSYSIFTLLAAIGDIIKEKDNQEEAFLNLSQIRSYLMPDFKRSLSLGGEAPGNDDGVSEKQEQIGEMEELEDMTQKWIEQFPDCGISPYLLGKISTRFFYALENIEKTTADNLGVKVYRQIRALFNAVLIEDIRENRLVGRNRKYTGRNISDININNTVESDKVFKDNLKQVNRIEGDFHFSRWFLSCPLLTAYLSKGLIEAIENYTGSGFASQVMSYNIYEKLTNVFLADRTVVRKNVVIEELPTFYGSFKHAPETIKVLMNIDSISFEEFFTLNIDNEKDRLHFLQKCEEYFKTPIRQDSLKGLQDKVIRYSNVAGNGELTQLVREWKNISK